VKPIIRISPSSLSLWNRCQYQFYFHSVLKVEPVYVPPSEPQLTGAEIHSVIEEYYRWLRGREGEMTEADIRLKLYQILEEHKLVDLESDDYESRRLRGLINNFVKFEMARLKRIGSAKLVGIEERYERVLELNSCSVQLVGVVDAIWDYMGTRIGLDWKTGHTRKRLSDDMVNQGLVYMLLADLDRFYFVFLESGQMVELKGYDPEEHLVKLLEGICERIRSLELEPDTSRCHDCPWNIPCKLWGWGIDLTNY